eukprot:14189101-Ditylum_brightwellii.AAC.1
MFFCRFGKECQVNITNLSNRCTSAEGALTLFFRGALSNEKKLILDAIKAGMKNGTFVSCHPAIVWITYMEEQKDGIDSVIEEPETESIRGKDSDFSIYSFVIVVVLGFGLAVLIGSRRHKANKRKNMKGDDKDKMNDSSSSSPDSEFYSEQGGVDSSDFSVDSIS